MEAVPLKNPAATCVLVAAHLQKIIRQVNGEFVGKQRLLIRKEEQQL